MDDFIPSENLTGVEQLKRSAVDQSVATQNVARLRRQLENEPDEFTRSALLKLLLHEAEKSCGTRQQLDRIDTWPNLESLPTGKSNWWRKAN
jgi:hypothetical protein